MSSIGSENENEGSDSDKNLEPTLTSPLLKKRKKSEGHVQKFLSNHFDFTGT